MVDPAAAPYHQTLRVLCASLMASLVIILVAVSATLGADGTGTPPAWALAVVLAVAAAEATLVPLLGYRFRPTAPGTAEADARADAVAQVQTTTILRFALCEAVALVGIALAFVVDDGGLFLCALGIVAAELLMLRHVWPGERMLTRVQESLEREGGRSYLREALAAPGPSRR